MDNAHAYLFGQLSEFDPIAGDSNIAAGWKGNNVELLAIYCHITRSLAEQFEIEPNELLKVASTVIDDIYEVNGPQCTIDLAALQDQLGEDTE